jgi:uncharacterized membrane protein
MPFLETELGAILLTFGTAMVPVLELRGAIPLGVAAGMPPLAALLVAVVGNMVPVPFIMLFIRRIFHWLRDKGKIGTLVKKLESRAEQKSNVVKKYAGIGLILLVAIPLPGTGAWTGALVAALMNMRLKRALPDVFIGVVIAGFVITCLTYGASHLLG